MVKYLFSFLSLDNLSREVSSVKAAPFCNFAGFVKGREEGKRFLVCRFSKGEQLSIAQPSTFGHKKTITYFLLTLCKLWRNTPLKLIQPVRFHDSCEAKP